MKGSLEVITGPMFSGKTEELLRRLKRVEIAGQNCAVFKPAIDDRYSLEEVVSHAGSKIKGYATVDWVHMYEHMDTLPYLDVIAIDEVQFFDEEMVETIQRLISLHRVIVSGLDMDFRRQPFGIMPNLLAIAKEVLKLTAVCQVCSADAMYTQRLLNGNPAPYAGETVIVGATEQYEARCGDCHAAG